MSRIRRCFSCEGGAPEDPEHLLFDNQLGMVERIPIIVVPT